MYKCFVIMPTTHRLSPRILELLSRLVATCGDSAVAGDSSVEGAPFAPPARHVDVPHCADGDWGVVSNLMTCDGMAAAAEATTFRLCWTDEYLSVQSVVVDSAVVSNDANW